MKLLSLVAQSLGIGALAVTTVACNGSAPQQSNGNAKPSSPGSAEQLIKDEFDPANAPAVASIPNNRMHFQLAIQDEKRNVGAGIPDEQVERNVLARVATPDQLKKYDSLPREQKFDFAARTWSAARPAAR